MTKQSTTALVAAFLALSVGTAVAQQQAPVVPYVTAKACLEKVSVVKDGKTYNLKEGVHFRSRAASDDPNVIEIPDSGISLAAGLREHAAWKAKVGQIEACLNLTPGLQYVGRTTK